MCGSCGCRRVWDAHQDARNITWTMLMNAALSAGIPPELAVENLGRAIDESKAVTAFLSQLSRPRVVCDIDGTLAERDVATCLVLNAKFNTEYHYNDIVSPNADDWIRSPA